MALISSLLSPFGLSVVTEMPYVEWKPAMIAPKFAQSGGSAMRLSWPSALAAATSALIPPLDPTDVTVLYFDPALLLGDEPMQPAHKTNATRAMPSSRISGTP
jgi:hypothetical protein